MTQYSQGKTCAICGRDLANNNKMGICGVHPEYSRQWHKEHRPPYHSKFCADPKCYKRTEPNYRYCKEHLAIYPKELRQ